jgi:MFS transporter, PPP family, 3-phenylpropionic acid transporter
VAGGRTRSAAALVRFAIGPVIGAWADGLADRRTAVRWLTTGALVAWALFFQVHGFVPLLVTGFFAATLVHAVTPLVEGATLRVSRADPIPYGVARGLGSAAFIVGNVGGGLLVARFGVGAAATWVLCTYLLTAVLAWTVLSPDPGAPGLDLGQRLGEVGKLLGRPDFLRVLLAAGLLQAAHAFYYGFSTLLWDQQGVGAGTIGALWAFGVLVEIAFLWTLPIFESRVGPEALMAAGAVGGTLRWLLLGFAPPLAALWPIQALHALSFAAAHVGAVRIVQRDAPGSIAGAAQTLYAAVAAGTMTGLATLASGVLYEVAGARGYWAMALSSAVAGVLLVRALRGRPPG